MHYKTGNMSMVSCNFHTTTSISAACIENKGGKSQTKPCCGLGKETCRKLDLGCDTRFCLHHRRASSRLPFQAGTGRGGRKVFVSGTGNRRSEGFLGVKD